VADATLLEGVRLLEEVRLLEDVRLLETGTPTMEDDTGVAEGIALVRETMPSKRNAAWRALRLTSLTDNIVEECLYRCW
jgi:hypothetical protein